MNDFSINTETVIEFCDLPKFSFTDSFITIGNFDGVHLGHQAIIKKMVSEARSLGSPIIVITFFPNPIDYFHPDIESYYLTTPEEKRALLLDLGVDEVLTLKFNQYFANLPPEEFLSKIKEKTGLKVLVVGENFALGKGRKGTIQVIEAIGEVLGFSLEVIHPVKLDDVAISSTKIRQMLDEGEVKAAAALLGRPYTLTGVVSHGSERGAKIGLPTTNLQHWPKKKQPGVGVYATWAVVRGELFMSMTNVGYRPTFENQPKPNVETHIFDFADNIYGEDLTLQFIQKIRDEQKFGSLQAFNEQIKRDKVLARKILENEER
jgi:riboflavin kinase/FMN adenylyltransferase